LTTFANSHTHSHISDMVVYSASGALVARRGDSKPSPIAMQNRRWKKQADGADNEVFSYIAAKGQTKDHLNVLEIASRSPIALFGMIPRAVVLFSVRTSHSRVSPHAHALTPAFRSLASCSSVGRRPLRCPGEDDHCPARPGEDSAPGPRRPAVGRHRRGGTVRVVVQISARCRQAGGCHGVLEREPAPGASCRAVLCGAALLV